MQISPDSDVIKRVSKGDRAAIGVLFERYHMGIFRYLYYKVGDVHTAEDLTSEVFLRMLKSLSQQQPNDLQIKAWLYKIARNLAIDYYRKHQNRQPVTLEENLPTMGTDEVDVDHTLNSQMLYNAVNQLSFDQREVVILRFINNLPIAEAAHVMERSEDAIKGLQRRALLSLRQVMVASGITP